MRKIILLLLFLPILGIFSCTKQRNCEVCPKPDEVVGMFQYLKKPYYGWYSRKKVKAILFGSDGYTDGEYEIVEGYIPEKYKSGKLIKVRACLQDAKKTGTTEGNTVWKIICIEKEE